METILDEELPRSRLAVLLKHFSQIEDGRQSWRVAFPIHGQATRAARPGMADLSAATTRRRLDI
jgi:hypothetical protein